MRTDGLSDETDITRIVHFMLLKGLDFADLIIPEIEQLIEEKKLITEEDKQGRIEFGKKTSATKKKKS